MDRVVLGSHNGINVPIHGVVNVGCPNGRKEQEAKVCQKVAGHKRHDKCVGAGLQDPIEGMKGDRGPRCQRLGCFVFVMPQMNVFVQKLVGVQGSVHPVNANFDTGKVNGCEKDVIEPSADFINGAVDLGVALFDEEFVDSGVDYVQEHGFLCQTDLIPYHFAGWHGSFGKDSLGSWMDVAMVMKEQPYPVVDNHGPDEIAQIAQQVVCGL